MFSKTDELGVPIFTFDDIFEAIYQGKVNSLDSIVCCDEKEIIKYNETAMRMFSDKLKIESKEKPSIEEYDSELQQKWFMPSKYYNLDLLNNLLDKCETVEERKRVSWELDEFASRNMTNVLKCMMYLVDYMQENNIVYGVGRGSSVSSFVLYLIGIHRVNPLKYDLDFKEFMRD